MHQTNNIKTYIKNRKEDFFSTEKIIENSLNFSKEYSLFIEELIRKIACDNLQKEGMQNYNFVITSAGSFSRRELSPYSDIDIMFIVPSVKEVEKYLKQLITTFWDYGIEVSHTIREIKDIKKFLKEDLHTFTQFFETRFLLGSKNLYEEWNQNIINSINNKVTKNLIEAFINDKELRYSKYGNSPKVIEPNVKMSAGALRDFQLVEWIYILKTKDLLNRQEEKTQAEIFIEILEKDNFTTQKECVRLLNSYNFILSIRNLLHLIHKQKNDRLEFNDQIKIAKLFHYKKDGYRQLMRDYFEASNIIYRFTRSFLKKTQTEYSKTIPDVLSIDLDDDFKLKKSTLYFKGIHLLLMSDILRAFYYRAFYNVSFDENLRMLIIDSLDNMNNAIDFESSVFFREILRAPKNVGKTLSVMNELGVLGTFIPEFNDINGFIQHGVYHCYTADEHTIITIQNVENLENDNSELGKIYRSLSNKEILFLSLLFHDIAKPIDISGHEIIGAEMASSIMTRLGYSDYEIEQVTFLVRNHLFMEQVAFRRNLNDPDTLNNFVSRFSSIEQLDLLYILTYADLSAVNPALWTSWKNDLLTELYRKSKAMLEEQLTGEELLISSTSIVPHNISKFGNNLSEILVQEHIELINDLGYISQFSDEEIAQHIEKISSGASLSIIFKELDNYTNITVITEDAPALLSKICGVFSINDINIHDAKIFTRKDGIVIDNFNVTDFKTKGKINREFYKKIEEDLNSVLNGLLQLSTEIKKMKSRWWRIENKFFKRPGQPRIKFEEMDKYTIIDIFSPDRLGFLYQITMKLYKLGLNIYFAKISTKGDDIVDSFYVLNNENKKVTPNYFNFIEKELTEAIQEIL